METNTRPKVPLYRAIALAVVARLNCIERENIEWLDRHTERIERLVKEYMPSGSGIDAGTKFDFSKSTGNRLEFDTSFHHMGEDGMYSGWSEHEVIVTPSLAFNFELRITGRDRNQIKDYLGETFHAALTQLVDPHEGN